MKIVTDSAADLPANEADALGINVVPLLIHFPEGEISSAAIQADTFYDRLATMFPNIPTTSLPSPGAFLNVYQELLRSDGDILSIHISSGLSATIQSARLATTQLPEGKITTVDTMTLSGAERFQVLAAAAAAKAGWAKESILDLLRRIQEQCEIVFTLDTLEYLARGGRIGRVQAMAGALLHIKPVIHVHRSDGKYSNVGKARTLARAEEIIVEHLVQLYGNTPLWVSVMHGRFAAHADALSSAMHAKLNCAKFELLRISPVLGVHTGPGVVGAAAVPLSLVSGLAI